MTTSKLHKKFVNEKHGVKGIVSHDAPPPEGPGDGDKYMTHTANIMQEKGNKEKKPVKFGGKG